MGITEHWLQLRHLLAVFGRQAGGGAVIAAVLKRLAGMLSPQAQLVLGRRERAEATALLRWGGGRGAGWVAGPVQAGAGGAPGGGGGVGGGMFRGWAGLFADPSAIDVGHAAANRKCVPVRGSEWH